MENEYRVEIDQNNVTLGNFISYCKSTCKYKNIPFNFNKDKFIIGNGDENTRYNVFTVGFDGTVHAATDVTAGGEKTNPDYKLSDIHSVLNKDWAFIGNAYADYDA